MPSVFGEWIILEFFSFYSTMLIIWHLVSEPGLPDPLCKKVCERYVEGWKHSQASRKDTCESQCWWFILKDRRDSVSKEATIVIHQTEKPWTQSHYHADNTILYYWKNILEEIHNLRKLTIAENFLKTFLFSLWWINFDICHFHSPLSLPFLC